jgi:hypothetical protein
MRKIWVIALILILSGCSVSLAKPVAKNAALSSIKSEKITSTIATQSQEEGDLYVGAIGNAKIHAKFMFSEDKVSGAYYYDKYKADIKLSGYIDNSIKDVLTFEVTEDTPEEGIMYFIVRSPEYIQGIWKNDNKIYPIYLVKEGANIVPPGLGLPKENSLRFEGHWTGKISEYFCGSQADIKVLSDDLLYYELLAYNGTATGALTGFAPISGNSAKTVFSEMTSEKNAENVVFEFNVDNNTLSLKSNSYDFQCGFAVSFDSSYTKGKVDISMPTAMQVGIVSTKDQDDLFKELVGDKYYDFIQYTQYVNFDDYNLDGGNVKVGISYLRGSSGYCIYVMSPKFMYAAIIEDDKIEYFSNDKRYAERLPQPIADWANENDDMTVEYNYKE